LAAILEVLLQEVAVSLPEGEGGKRKKGEKWKWLEQAKRTFEQPRHHLEINSLLPSIGTLGIRACKLYCWSRDRRKDRRKGTGERRREKMKIRYQERRHGVARRIKLRGVGEKHLKEKPSSRVDSKPPIRLKTL